jgi:putative addiction module component (TIGR02574 family)
MASIDISGLSPEERLALISELWDSLDAKDVPLTEAQKAELDRRLETFDEDVKGAKTWEQIEVALNRRAK